LPAGTTSVPGSFRDFHPGHYDELAAQHLVRFVLIRQLAGHPAILQS